MFEELVSVEKRRDDLNSREGIKCEPRQTSHRDYFKIILQKTRKCHTCFSIPTCKQSCNVSGYIIIRDYKFTFGNITNTLFAEKCQSPETEKSLEFPKLSEIMKNLYSLVFCVFIKTIDYRRIDYRQL